jgi:hypothetical protein
MLVTLMLTAPQEMVKFQWRQRAAVSRQSCVTTATLHFTVLTYDNVTDYVASLRGGDVRVATVRAPTLQERWCKSDGRQRAVRQVTSRPPTAPASTHSWRTSGQPRSGSAVAEGTITGNASSLSDGAFRNRSAGA